MGHPYFYWIRKQAQQDLREITVEAVRNRRSSDEL